MNTSKAILTTYDTLAPLKQINSLTSHKPWLSDSMRTLMKERDKSFKVAKQSNLVSDFVKFRFLRHRVSNSLSTAKSAYFSSRLRQASTVEAKWRELRKLGIATCKKSSPFQHFQSNDLNLHFSNVARKSPPSTPNEIIKILNDYPLNTSRPIFNFTEVTDIEVNHAIMSSRSQALGDDALSSHMLKLIAPAMRPPLTAIFNSSINLSHYPSEWKKTLISPVLKTINPQSPSDTRPIARLSEISKALERLVHRQLINHLETNNLLDPRQTGFRAGHSTQTALLEVIEFIRESIDRRKLTILVLFDFEKAFDSIPHTVLLKKLRQLNCSDNVINWFFSYLSNRSQAVINDEGETSAWLETYTGVPQGSVLGPLLFLIFINDLRFVLKRSKHILFADDLQIFKACFPDELHDGLLQMNDEALAVANWAEANGLRLNLSKTKVMILGSKGHLKEIDFNLLQPLVIGTKSIPFVNEFRNLGLQITSSLSWDNHINGTVSRVNGILHSLRKAKHALTMSMRKYLVETLVLQHFDYACAVLSDLNDSQNTRLQNTMNACVRFVLGFLKPFEHVNSYGIALGWLSTRSRRDYFLINQAFSVLSHGNEYLSSRFSTFEDNAHLRRTDRFTKPALIVPFARTEAFRRSFTVSASKLLNDLNVSKFDPSDSYSLKIRATASLLERDKLDWLERVTNEGLDCPSITLNMLAD